MDLSIIIPIYNTGKNELERCLTSIYLIEGIWYECLLIDDGSAYETAEFCKMYASKHPTFRYVGKDNGGVSSARNLGIREATGRYICFVDSDDEILPEVYSHLRLVDDAYDLIFTDLVEVNGKRQTRWKAFEIPGAISYETVVERLVNNNTLNGPYCKFIKTSFLEESGVLFNEAMIQGEDAVFLCELLMKKPKLYYYDIVSYLYYHSYAHGNQRFVKEPMKCIWNAAQHNDVLVSCIEMSAFIEKNILFQLQAAKYTHELFCRALDSIEYGVFSKELQKTIVESLPKIEHIPSIKANSWTSAKAAFLRRNNWWALRYVEKMRSLYYRIKGLR